MEFSLIWLLWLPLGMDLLLAAMTYPMFLFQGLPWFLTTLGADTKKTEASSEALAKDSRIRVIWDTLLIAYTGYVSLLFLAGYCTWRHPELCATPTAWAMLALMVTKIVALRDMGDTNKAKGGKEYTLFLFYLPTYGGYAILTSFFDY